jgi:hypothetical protein
MTSLQVFKTTMQYWLERENKVFDTLAAWHIDGTRRKEMWIENRNNDLSSCSTKVVGSAPSSGVYVCARSFHIESKGKSLAWDLPLWATMQRKEDVFMVIGGWGSFGFKAGCFFLKLLSLVCFILSLTRHVLISFPSKHILHFGHYFENYTRATIKF